MRQNERCEDLLAKLHGPFEPIRERISFGEEKREVVSAEDLLAGDRLRQTLARYGRRHGREPDRCLASLWSQKYLATLIVPTVALNAACGEPIDARIERVCFVLDDSGEPVALRMPVAASEGDVHDFVPRLVSTHLEPFVRTVARLSGLSEKVLWGNAAHYLEWIWGRVAARRVELPPPMASAIRYVEENGKSVRRRQVCCLRDRVPGVEHCGSLCPKEKMRVLP